MSAVVFVAVSKDVNRLKSLQVKHQSRVCYIKNWVFAAASQPPHRLTLGWYVP